jgi:hypothetical protein
MKVITHYVRQNSNKHLLNIGVNKVNSQTMQDLLQNKSSLAEIAEVFDLDLSRASRSAKHVKKYLMKKQLHPFEILVHKN